MTLLGYFDDFFLFKMNTFPIRSVVFALEDTIISVAHLFKAKPINFAFNELRIQEVRYLLINNQDLTPWLVPRQCAGSNMSQKIGSKNMSQ